MRSKFLIPLIVALLALLGRSAAAQEHVRNLSLVIDPREYVGYDQKLGAKIPGDLTFTDESGKPVRLLDFAKDRPLVLALVYYSCPRLCTEVLNGSVRMLRAMDRLELGSDFQFVAVSIDPKDTPQIASQKRDTYLEALGAAGRPEGWHFLTGDQASITRLAQTVGFRYVWDEHTEQYAHDGGILVVTPQGKVSHYFFGIEFSPFDVRLALIEALGPIAGIATEAGERLRQAVAARRALDPEKSQRVIADIESAVDARLAVSRMERDAARLIVARNLKKVEGGFAWRSDPRLTLPPTCAPTRLSSAAGSPPWKHRPWCWPPIRRRLTSVPGCSTHAWRCCATGVRIPCPAAITCTWSKRKR